MSLTNTKKAFITGITEQDGSYLAELICETVEDDLKYYSDKVSSR